MKKTPSQRRARRIFPGFLFAANSRGPCRPGCRGTPLPSAGSWEYELAEVTGDATVDLVGILRSGGSNSTEVHAVSGASGFTTFVLQAGTALHTTNADWTFEMVRWDDPSLFGFELLGNGPDLVAINRNAPLAVEVHILSP